VLVNASRLRHLFVVSTFALVLAACSSGSTDVTTDEPTGPTATAPTGPTETGATGTTGVEEPTGSTEAVSIAGTWDGTWTTDVTGSSGSFSMTFEETAAGFSGTIQIQGSECVSNGKVDATVDGTSITIGAVQAEEQIEFDGEVSGDQMSETYRSPAGCGNDTGTWVAIRAG
jgi:hypothetical protein